MSTIHLDHISPRNPASHSRPLSAVLLAAALAIVVASSLTAAAPSAWTALKGAYQSQPDLTQCALIATGSERLACFDRLGKQALQPPAKGANAPLIALSAARKKI